MNSSEPGQPAQDRPLPSLTPCTSREPGQPAQDRHVLSLSSRPSTKLLRSSKLEPCSSLAKLVFQVLPKNIHDKVLAFDQLRSDVKSAKTGNTLSHINLQKYQTASTNLKQELLAQLKKNSKAILQYIQEQRGRWALSLRKATTSQKQHLKKDLGTRMEHHVYINKLQSYQAVANGHCSRMLVYHDYHYQKFNPSHTSRLHVHPHTYGRVSSPIDTIPRIYGSP